MLYRKRLSMFSVTCLYIHFASTPTSILNLTIAKEREFDTEFSGIPCVRKYCQFFTHESIIDQHVSVFVCRHCKVLDENLAKCRKPCQKQPLSLEARGLPSNTWMPGPTPLDMPNDSSIALRTSTQRCNKVPIGYNGMPQIHPQTAASPSTITTKI